jgi:phosphoglycolate phosphatase-like HAD superfamily hydrolase
VSGGGPGAGLWLFDIDGTLVAQSGDQLAAWSAAFRGAFGLEVPAAHIARELGRTFAEVVRAVVQPLGHEADPPAVALALSAYTRHVREALAVRPARLLPGARRILEALRAAGSLVGVVSGNFAEEGEPKLLGTGLLPLLDVVVYSDLHTPGREVLVQRAVGLARARGFRGGFRGTTVVGDSVHDVESARRTGARSAAVCTGVTGRDALAAAAPDLLVADLPALLAVLESACAPSNAPRSA